MTEKGSKIPKEMLVVATATSRLLTIGGCLSVMSIVSITAVVSAAAGLALLHLAALANVSAVDSGNTINTDITGDDEGFTRNHVSVLRLPPESLACMNWPRLRIVSTLGLNPHLTIFSGTYSNAMNVAVVADRDICRSTGINSEGFVVSPHLVSVPVPQPPDHPDDEEDDKNNHNDQEDETSQCRSCNILEACHIEHV